MTGWNYSSQRTTTLDLSTIVQALYVSATKEDFVHDGRLIRLRGTAVGVEAALLGVGLMYWDNGHQQTPIGHRVKLDRWILRAVRDDTLPGKNPATSVAWQAALAQKELPIPVGRYQTDKLLRWKIETDLILDRWMASVNDLALKKGILPVSARIETHVASQPDEVFRELAKTFGGELPTPGRESGELSWVDSMQPGTGSNGIVYGVARCSRISPAVTKIVAEQYGSFFVGAAAKQQQPEWNKAFAESFSRDMATVTASLSPVDKTAVLGF